MATKELLTGDDDNTATAPRPEHEEIVIVEDKPTAAATSDDHDEDEEDDQPAKTTQEVGGTDDEREAIRERRRLEKLERKERKERAMARDKLEMDFLRKRNDDLERRFTTIEQRQRNTDINQVDVSLREALNEVDMAEKVIAKAVEAGNGADVTQAMRYRDQAIAKANQLSAAKQQAQRTTQAPAASGMDDMTLHYAKEFIKDNNWYDPQGKDEDSAIVMAIDNTLVRDGFRTDTPEYWDELKKRAAKRLPERFNAAKAPEREARGGPAIGSGKEHAPTSSRREVYISPERKQALQDAGVWDDQVLRQKYVKRYMQYDRDNKA